jgi:hypothetical protein
MSYRKRETEIQIILYKRANTKELFIGEARGRNRQKVIVLKRF